MPKNSLLSIGDISELTGVHISSLRYYDRIGVLKPVYLDPKTNYRYYHHLQIGLLQILQTFIALGIPLKEFLEYTDRNGEIVRFEELLNHSQLHVEKKMVGIRNGINLIKFMKQDMEYNDDFLMTLNQTTTYKTRKSNLFVVPMKGPVSEENYLTLRKIRSLATEQGFFCSYLTGMLYVFDRELVAQYYFIEVVSLPKGAQRENIMSIPASEYQAKRVEMGAINHAPEQFPKLFDMDYKKYVIESELLFGNTDVLTPMYELRCTTPESAEEE